MRLLFAISLLFAAISGQFLKQCTSAPATTVTMDWPANTQDKEALLNKVIAATNEQNEQAYAKYTDAELLNLEQLADKFDENVVKKFEKIAQIRAFKPQN